MNCHYVKEGVFYLNKNIKDLFYFIFRLCSCKKIFLHGLFDSKFIFFLLLTPWNLHKIYWLVWGGDLYIHLKNKSTLTEHIKFFAKSFLIKRISFVVTYIKYDYYLSKKIFKHNAKYRTCLLTLSNTFSASNSTEYSTIDGHILVGNSGSISNNHKELLLKLRNLDGIKKLFLPISYGEIKNINELKSFSYHLFNNKVELITNIHTFISFKSFISSIQIAFFNHIRQEAMGTSILLLGSGKTLYLRSDSPQYEFFRDNNIMVYDSINPSLKTLSLSKRHNNIGMVSSLFSVDRIYNDYKQLLY